MNTDLIKLFEQLDDMEQTKEVLQIKNQIRESLYQNLRHHYLELIRIGRAIGYDELQAELQNAIHLLETDKKSKP